MVFGADPVFDLGAKMLKGRSVLGEAPVFGPFYDEIL